MTAIKIEVNGLDITTLAEKLDTLTNALSYRTIQNFMSAENWKEKRQALKK